MKNNLNKQEQYKTTVQNNQLVLVLNSEILLPEDAPVRVTSAQLEELEPILSETARSPGVLVCFGDYGLAKKRQPFDCLFGGRGGT